MVVDEARSWLGVPWRHQGRTRAGIDCVGIVVAVCRALHISDYDFAGYDRRPFPGGFLGHFIAGGARRIAVLAARPGDLLAMRDDAYPCHVAIVTERLGQPHIVHATAARRKVVEELLAHEWLAKRVAAFALPGVA